jgi:hypothetical protein
MVRTVGAREEEELQLHHSRGQLEPGQGIPIRLSTVDRNCCPLRYNGQVTIESAQLQAERTKSAEAPHNMHDEAGDPDCFVRVI